MTSLWNLLFLCKHTKLVSLFLSILNPQPKCLPPSLSVKLHLTLQDRRKWCLLGKNTTNSSISINYFLFWVHGGFFFNIFIIEAGSTISGIPCATQEKENLEKVLWWIHERIRNDFEESKSEKMILVYVLGKARTKTMVFTWYQG